MSSFPTPPSSASRPRRGRSTRNATAASSESSEPASSHLRVEPTSVKLELNVDAEEEDSKDAVDVESEYEVEEVLDAKRGYFPGKRMGYLVKWKGYDSSENSWVDEMHAGDATDSINRYWKKHARQPQFKSTSSSVKREPKQEPSVSQLPTKARRRKTAAGSSRLANNNPSDDPVHIQNPSFGSGSSASSASSVPTHARSSQKRRRDESPTVASDANDADEEEEEAPRASPKKARLFTSACIQTSPSPEPETRVQSQVEVQAQVQPEVQDAQVQSQPQPQPQPQPQSQPQQPQQPQPQENDAPPPCESPSSSRPIRERLRGRFTRKITPAPKTEANTTKWSGSTS